MEPNHEVVVALPQDVMKNRAKRPRGGITMTSYLASGRTSLSRMLDTKLLWNTIKTL